MEPSVAQIQCGTEPLPDLDGKVLRRWDNPVKRRHFLVQEAVVHLFYHLPLQNSLKLLEVENHPGDGIRRTIERHFQNEVVAVAMRIGSIAIDRVILFVTEGRVSTDVRCGKLYSSCN